MDPFGKTFLNNISLNVTGSMEISVDPLGKSIFFDNVSLSVTGYMEISLDPLGKEFLNLCPCYRIHGNFHGPFR